LISTLPVFIDLITSSSYAIQESSIYCITSAIQDEAGKAAFIRHKHALEYLVKALDSPRETVVMRACAIMDKLISGQIKMQEAFTKAGVATKLVHLLNHNAQRVKQHAAYAIWALCNMNEQGQKAMYKAKGIAALVTLLGKEDSTPILKEYCAGAICSLTQDDSSNKKALLAANGYDSLIPLLSSSVDAVASAAAKSIWASAESNVANQNAAKGAIAPLTNLLKSRTPVIQASSASALWSLCQNNSTNQSVILEVNAIPELIEVINQHAKDYMTNPKDSIEKGQALLAAVGTIHALTIKNNACRDVCSEKGAFEAIELLISVADRHLAKEVNGALANLGKKDRTRSRAGSFFATVTTFLTGDKEKSEEKKDENKEKEKDEKKDSAPKEKKKKKKSDDEKKESTDEKEHAEEKKAEKSEEKTDEKKEKKKKKEKKTEETKSVEPTTTNGSESDKKVSDDDKSKEPKAEKTEEKPSEKTEEKPAEGEPKKKKKEK